MQALREIGSEIGDAMYRNLTPGGRKKEKERKQKEYDEAAYRFLTLIGPYLAKVNSAEPDEQIGLQRIFIHDNLALNKQLESGEREIIDIVKYDRDKESYGIYYYHKIVEEGLLIPEAENRPEHWLRPVQSTAVRIDLDEDDTLFVDGVSRGDSIFYDTDQTKTAEQLLNRVYFPHPHSITRGDIELRTETLNLVNEALSGLPNEGETQAEI